MLLVTRADVAAGHEEPVVAPPDALERVEEVVLGVVRVVEIREVVHIEERWLDQTEARVGVLGRSLETVAPQLIESRVVARTGSARTGQLPIRGKGRTRGIFFQSTFDPYGSAQPGLSETGTCGAAKSTVGEFGTGSAADGGGDCAPAVVPASASATTATNRGASRDIPVTPMVWTRCYGASCPYVKDHRHKQPWASRPISAIEAGNASRRLLGVA